MVQIEIIESLDHPELAPYRSMKWQWEHRQQGLFVAEGEKVVRRLLDSPFAIVSILLPQKWLPAYEPLLQRRAENIRAFVGEKELLERLTGFSMYQGVLALARVPERSSLETILARSSRPRFLVAAEGLSNAENMGVLIRNCGAFGVQALFSGETCASPFLRRAVRSSMGVIFQLPVLEVDDLVASLRRLKEEGIRCLAAHPHEDQNVLGRVDLTGDCCLVFGSEGEGLSPATLAACDGAISIPMQNGVDSLNVGSASAAFLYEVFRQRSLETT